MDKKSKKLLKAYKKMEKRSELCTRQFSAITALGVYLGVVFGANKRLHDDSSIFGNDFIQYSSGSYEVQSMYDTGTKKYFTQITKNAQKYYAYRQMNNKIVQRLLHEYGKMYI